MAKGSLTWRDRGFVALIAALVAAGHSLAVPFVANQNQYFVHAVGDADPRLAADYLVGTEDPYPFFSWVMKVVYSGLGIAGVRFLAYLATLGCLIAVFMLARRLQRGTSLGTPVVAMMLVGATVTVGRLGSFIPYDWSVSAFQGFAGQYILMKPGYFQPSTAGMFLLLALPLWLSWFGEAHSRRLWQPVAAIALTVVACALAPTYLVVTGVGLAAALAADLMTGARFSRLGWYVGTVVIAGVAAIAANPALVDIGTAGLAGAEALRRFAFELFPIHTLFSNWPPDDSTLLLVIAVAVILTPLVRYGRWLSRWLLLATAMALVGAAVVYVTRMPALALLFPWRVSVILVPVAATVIAVWVATMLRRLPHDHWRWKLLLIAAVVAVPGVASTVAKQSPAVSEPATAAAAQADPVGVGLIPLAAGTLRLNARVPVYVDAASPPYASQDLVEWWERVDAVRQFESDPESFCTADWSSEIDWMQIPSGVTPPSCVSAWTVLVDTGQWVVLQAPGS